MIGKELDQSRGKSREQISVSLLFSLPLGKTARPALVPDETRASGAI
jgi:hypothetical protein